MRLMEYEEDIPSGVVNYFSIMDGGDPIVPPRFSCEACGGEMAPINYKEFMVYNTI